MSTQVINQSIYLPTVPSVTTDIVNKSYVDNNLSRLNFFRAVESYPYYSNNQAKLPATKTVSLLLNTWYNIDDYYAVTAAGNGSNFDVITLTITFKTPDGQTQDFNYTAPGHASGAKTGGDDTYIDWDQQNLYYSYGYPDPKTVAKTQLRPFKSVTGVQFNIQCNKLNDKVTVTATPYTSKKLTNLNIINNYGDGNGNQSGNPFATTTLLASATNIWRQFNKVEINSSTNQNNNFAKLITLSAPDLTYITVQPGTYQIDAGGIMTDACSHCVALVQYNYGYSTFQTLGYGTICYCNNTIGDSNTNTSFISNRFTFTNPIGTNIGLVHYFNGSYSYVSNKVTLTNYANMGQLFALSSVPLNTYLPNVNTAWINIEKIY